ncbi:MAG: tRNA (adenosine(37)-N6)-threonylcarbamoyltransferase complex dimerization subunit type 1 TsaB [Candidatus Binatia bacterium]
MKILGIDTATATASAALVEQGKVILEEVGGGNIDGESSPFKKVRANHAATLLPLLEGLLQKVALSLPEISALAVSIGPGSFTGLRIGLSTVKGLAYGWEIPVVGVSTLLAVAHRVTGWEGLICPLLDARKKEVYAALFRSRGDVVERLIEDAVLSPERIIEDVRSRSSHGSCLFIGDGATAYEHLIKKVLGESSLVTMGERYPSIASAVARLAEGIVQKRGFHTQNELIPLYLRSSEAEVKSGLTI